MKNIISEPLNFYNRHNFHVVKCKSDQLNIIINELVNDSIRPINIGLEVSNKIKLAGLKHLTIKIQELLNHLVESNSTEIFSGKPKVIALYNLGILFEPSIKFNVEQILKELSKQYCLIILWDGDIDDNYILHWGKQKENFQINLSDIKPLIIDKTS